MEGDDANDARGNRAAPGTGLPIRARTVAFKVPPEDAGLRLDQVLPRHVEGLSRRQARTLLDLGGVFVNSARTKTAGRAMKAGEEVTAYIGGALARAENRVGAAAREKDAARLPTYHVLFEDEHVVVVNKPAGLLTAPTPESDRNNLADLLARRQARRQTILVVHRLDLQTSGVLVFAKTAAANRVLSERFAVHDMERAYRAVVAGAFPEDVARIDRPVAGKRALTHVVVEQRLGEVATMLRLRLETGRTHQIRLHVGALGHPVLGDPDVRGAPVPAPPRMALHAERLGFKHPVTGGDLDFHVPWPDDLQRWWQRLGAWVERKAPRT